jgi:ornithine cyclodeaminase
MLMLDADRMMNCMPMPRLVDGLAALHREPIGMIDELLMESKDADDNLNHFFIRAGWQPEKAVGAKIITVFPRNNLAARKPSIQAVYILFEAVEGSPLACLDGTALTWLKTAADSALGARLLARAGSESMLMIGAGQMAPHLLRAHCQVLPALGRIRIWNRSPAKAEALCARMAEEFGNIDFGWVDDIEPAAADADLICCATGSKQPLLRGEWLKPGAHVDLVGAFTADMREADDECLRRGSLFVDARETTLQHIGELSIPLESGVISADDVLADLSDLCQHRHPGRISDDEITIFKNGGGGHLDLMCARLLHRHCQDV